MKSLLEQLKNAPRKRAKLSDFIRIKHGYAFKGEHFSAQPTKDVLVTPGNFAIGGGFKAEKYKYYAGPVLEDYVLNEGDLVVTMTDLSVNADTLGYSALIPKVEGVRFLHNQRVGLVQKIKDGIDISFLYFLMRTRKYQSHVVGGASGSTVKHTSPDRITSFEYDFPSLGVQKRIATILIAYEIKIRNNQELIGSLENINRTIFGQHFNPSTNSDETDELIGSELGKLPDGWSTLRIKDIAKVTLGGTPSRARQEFWGGDIPWINSGEVNNLRIVLASELITREGLENSNARLMKPGTVVLAITGATLGQVSRLEIEAAANQSVIGIFSEQAGMNEYLYHYMKRNIRRLISGASGGAQQHINKNMVENHVIAVPPANELSRFHDATAGSFASIKSLLSEIPTLKEVQGKLLHQML